MARVKTFTNGGSVLPSDLNLIQDDYEGIYSQYRDVLDKSSVILSGGSNATVTLIHLYGGVTAATTTTDASSSIWYHDPADYAVANRTTKLRFRGRLITGGATAIGANLTLGIYGASVPAGSTNGIAFTLGSLVASVPTLAFTGLATNTMYQQVTADFNASLMPAGYYVFGLAQSTALGSTSGMRAMLQVRNT